MPEWLMRFSIHVDAGYLYGALATRETGSSNRDAITVDDAVLIRDLVQQAADDSGATLLRVLWYDAGRNGLPDGDQRRIGMLPGVKLRMGRINPFGEQKGCRPAARARPDVDEHHSGSGGGLRDLG